MYTNILKQRVLLVIAFGILSLSGFFEITAQTDSGSPPNIIVLFTDDMGYGDLSSYGHPTIRTPNIDQLAKSGVRFTSFYTANWCVPSRTQLMTGRYETRVDFGGSTSVDGNGGLPDREVTLAEALKQAGYDTGMAGKWHLGYKKDKYLPTGQGFDSWIGIPYSNDMMPPWVNTDEPMALYSGTDIAEHPLDQDKLTTTYTREALKFIDKKSNSDNPFFFYLAYNMPHLPLHTAERFRGSSDAGLYGDVIETIDWSVGQILNLLEKKDLDNTIVFFASDNGPWLDLPDRWPHVLQGGNKQWHAGSPGLLRGGKKTTFEGGHRVPAIISWPGQIPSGRVTDEIAATPDIYRTLIHAAGAEVPDLALDGHNLLPFLKGQTDESPRNRYYYYRGNTLKAMRRGSWKLRLTGNQPQLFNLQIDPAERFNRADGKPDLVESLRKQMKQFANDAGGHLP